MVRPPIQIQNWGFAPQLQPYQPTWERQVELHRQVASGTLPDTLALLEHDAVYTAGKLTKAEDLPASGTEVVRVDRGGRITWHGPGQLIGYPIVKLPQPFDVVGFVRRLEDVLIDLCLDFGVLAHRIEGRSGVWVRENEVDAKVAAIGLRVSKGVTMHGFAINCDCDLAPFSMINPCGITDAGVTSLTKATGRRVTVSEVAAALATKAENGALSPRPVREPKRLLRIEAKNSQTPIERKPRWIKAKIHTGPEFLRIHSLVKDQRLNTVCQQAGCPNIYECWESREATFLIGGDSCTRRCDFCQIATGKPLALDKGEPLRVAQSVRTMGLAYATVTGVARDDLVDGGAWLYAETVRQIHNLVDGCGVELLIPDFSGKIDLLTEVFESAPEVLAHNLETVPRIFARIRPGFRYERSLDVLTNAKARGLITKSNLILGMGEEIEEAIQVMQDLRAAGCDLLTITQYLRPSAKHHPISRWVKPEEFLDLGQEATRMGFLGVMSGPLVRSSYKAGELYRRALASKSEPAPSDISDHVSPVGR